MASSQRKGGAVSSRNGGSAVAEPEDARVGIAKITLPQLTIQRAEIPIVGVTPIIPHAWSEKSLAMMREAQSGPKARRQHEPKDAVAEAEGSCYYLEDGTTPGMPATAFKAALVGAARFFQGVTMTMLKQAVFVDGVGSEQLVALEGERYMREDTPRNANGSPDLRYRYTYWPWSTVLPVRFIADQLDIDSVLRLVNAGGMGGVGDWRPSAPKSLTGTFGQFEVDPEREVKVS